MQPTPPPQDTENTVQVEAEGAPDTSSPAMNVKRATIYLSKAQLKMKAVARSLRMREVSQHLPAVLPAVVQLTLSKFVL